MTGSTLYRRLPDGTWAAQREDGVPAGAADPADDPAADPVDGAGTPGAAPQAASHDAPASSAPPAPLKSRRRWPVRRILAGAVVAYLVWLVGLVVYAAVSLPSVEALSPDPIPDTDGTVWLLVGSDSRERLTRREQRRLHTGNEEGQRTDTIMLVHTRVGQAPTMVSVPRDSWVTIPAHTATDGSEVGDQQGKVNAAYAYGGAPLLSQTIEHNTGLRVDHYMEVGMDGIVALTDAVGGVEVCFDEAISDENSGLDVEAGCQTLDGPTSLAWVRMRYADPTGDLGRMQRQQKYVALMMDQILTWQTVVNPVRQWRIVNAGLESVVVDDASGPVDLARFGMGMARVAGGSAEVTTVPADDSDHWEAGQWVIKWDQAEAAELFAALGGSPPLAPSPTQE